MNSFVVDLSEDTVDRLAARISERAGQTNVCSDAVPFNPATCDRFHLPHVPYGVRSAAKFVLVVAASAPAAALVELGRRLVAPEAILMGVLERFWSVADELLCANGAPTVAHPWVNIGSGPFPWPRSERTIEHMSPHGDPAYWRSREEAWLAGREAGFDRGYEEGSVAHPKATPAPAARARSDRTILKTGVVLALAYGTYRLFLRTWPGRLAAVAFLFAFSGLVSVGLVAVALVVAAVLFAWAVKTGEQIVADTRRGVVATRSAARAIAARSHHS